MLRLVKAQAMIEYFIYFGISLLVFTSVLTFVFLYENSEVTELKYTALVDRGTEIQSLFFVLVQMNPVFNQTIHIDETINGETYDFEILNNNLYLTQSDLEIILPLPEIIGNTTNKTFTITIVPDGVYLN